MSLKFASVIFFFFVGCFFFLQGREKKKSIPREETLTGMSHDNKEGFLLRGKTLFKPSLPWGENMYK